MGFFLKRTNRQQIAHNRYLNNIPELIAPKNNHVSKRLTNAEKTMLLEHIIIIALPFRKRYSNSIFKSVHHSFSYSILTPLTVFKSTYIVAISSRSVRANAERFQRSGWKSSRERNLAGIARRTRWVTGNRCPVDIGELGW